jgi:hypothetical protein
MAIVAITGPASVLSQLTDLDGTFPLAVAANTAADNGDGTWTVTAETPQVNIPAVTEIGATVQLLVSDDDELALWQAIDDQIDRGPGTTA